MPRADYNCCYGGWTYWAAPCLEGRLMPLVLPVSPKENIKRLPIMPRPYLPSPLFVLYGNACIGVSTQSVVADGSLNLCRFVSLGVVSFFQYYFLEFVFSNVMSGSKRDTKYWGNAEVGPMPEIAILRKRCYVEATCRLAYEALVEAINECLPQNKNKSFLSTRRARTFQWFVFHYLLTHEKLNYSLSMRLFLMLSRVWFVWYMHLQMFRPLTKYCFTI